MRPQFICAFALLLPATFASVAESDAYSIRLQRRFTAGQSFSVSTTHAQRTSQRTDRGDATGPKTQSLRRVLLDADVHIDKADDKQAQASVTIRKLELTSPSGGVALSAAPTAPVAVLPSGTELLLTYTGSEITFRLKNKQDLSPEALFALQQSFQTMALSDALYGTTDKKKVGDSWPLNTKTLVVDRMDPLSLDSSQVSGATTLKGVRDVYGIPCLLLEGTQTTKDAPVVGIVPKESTATTTFSLTVPVALDKPLVAYTIKAVRHMIVVGQPSEDSTLTADIEDTHEATWIPK